MIALTAREALDPRVARVTTTMRPVELAEPARRMGLYAVFDDESGRFLRLVPAQDATPFPHRIFADLLPKSPPAPVVADASLDAVSDRMATEGMEALPVLDEQGAFLGVITRPSLLESLLRQEGELLAEAGRLQERLEAEQQRLVAWSKRLEELNEASRTLLGLVGQTAVERGLMQEGLQALVTLVQARYGAIGLLDETGRLQQFTFAGITAEEADRFEEVVLGPGLLGATIRDNQVLRLADLGPDASYAGFPPPHAPMKSLLAVPISHQGQIYGRVYLCDKTTDEPFTENDERLAVSFARSLALAFAHARELAERKRAEEALRKSEEAHRTVVQNINEIIYAVRMENDPLGGTVELVGDQVENIIGYRPDEFLQDPGLWFRLIHPDDVPAVVETTEKLFTRKELVTRVYRVRHKTTAEYRWMEDRVVPQIDDRGSVVGIFGVARDVTERKCAEKALAERTRLLEAVRAVTQEITRELNLSTLLRLIHQRAAELVGAMAGVVFLWDEAAQVLVPQAWHGYGDWLGEVRRRLGEGLAGTVAQRREGLIDNDYRAAPYANHLLLERTRVTAAIAEPLLYRGRLLGVITVADHGTGRAFGEADHETLTLLAGQAAIAIENARLYEEAERRQNAAEGLAEVGRLVSQSLDPEEVAQRIVDNVRRLLDVQAATLFRLEPESGDLVTIATSSDVQPALVKNEVLPQDSATVGLAVRERKPVTTSDFLTDPRITLTPELRARLEQLSYRAVLAVPLVVQERVIGALSVGYPAGRVFGQEETQLVKAFADQAAIALENAQMFKQVQVGRERLQNLSRRLVETQEAERRHLARELHDEIGQVLTGLNLTLEMTASLPARAVRDSLDKAQALVNDLIAHVRDLSLDLRPGMLDDLGLLPALLWHFERYTALTRVRVNFRHTGLEGQRFAPDLETATYRIVQEALTNVARHAAVGEVTVRLWASEDLLGLQVEDQGTGFVPEATLAAGASSGLAGMRERAILLDGQLTIESAPGAGTRVTAELPLGDPLERREQQR